MSPAPLTLPDTSNPTNFPAMKSTIRILKTIHKVRFDTDFSIIPNTVAQTSSLSYAARGLLVYLLSLPDTWEIRVDELQKNGTIGRDGLRSIISELAAAGHMHRFAIPGKTHDSFSGSRWQVFADPAALTTQLSRKSGFHRRPTPFPTVGKPVDVHKETVQATKTPNKRTRPIPTHAELSAFLAANGLSERIGKVFFDADDAYQAFPTNTDGSTPHPRDWRTALLAFAKQQNAA